MSELLPLLSARTGLREADLLSVIRTAPVRYKSFTIPKRNGGRRLISQPAKEVKLIQRVLAEEILDHFLIHPAATAYRKGTSIWHNAKIHAGIGPILKYDFLDFFPSFTDKDWKEFCIKNNVFREAIDIAYSTNILFRRQPSTGKLSLAIGAPSSPMLSNALMYQFDSMLSQRILGEHVLYTRYADDLVFSAKRTGFLSGVPKALALTIKEISFPRLRVNTKKTVLATRKYKRVVTGLILTNEGKISIGYDRKRDIRASMHRASLNKLSNKEMVELAGMLAFTHDVEPDYLEILAIRYGPDVLLRLKQARKPPWPLDDT